MNHVAVATLLAIFGCTHLATAACSPQKGSGIVHDTEFYVLESQNGERWAAEDQALDQKLAALREAYRLALEDPELGWENVPY